MLTLIVILFLFLFLVSIVEEYVDVAVKLQWVVMMGVAMLRKAVRSNKVAMLKLV